MGEWVLHYIQTEAASHMMQGILTHDIAWSFQGSLYHQREVLVSRWSVQLNLSGFKKNYRTNTRYNSKVLSITFDDNYPWIKIGKANYLIFISLLVINFTLHKLVAIFPILEVYTVHSKYLIGCKGLWHILQLWKVTCIYIANMPFFPFAFLLDVIECLCPGLNETVETRLTT